ncbi:MAG TPA: cyclopropane-fatty-acyl-phospholipid synthase family protein [Rhizomicrobium sp.]|jgi:cyclopropane-fatty-acyl-phospholipid synthase|nr:cyclopropane-fatty-acyl-phospholipid synthase family protein [Rhizomicrobium sp.]
MLDILLSKYIRRGRLAVRYPNGKTRIYGEGKPAVAIAIADAAALLALGLDPDLKLGELYMDGRLVIEQGDIVGLMDILMGNLARAGGSSFTHGWLRAVRRSLRMFAQWNPARAARAHVAHHYDLSGHLYDLFLDAGRQYSCAYFAHDQDTLEEAQAEKKRHIAAKLHFDRPGLSVLDIGCGWGGLALDLARLHRANVLGITLSTEQLAAAQARAQQTGLASQSRFELLDYRAVTGQFDRIVSVGMFEHVGARYYPDFFAKARELLADDGVMLLHTIGRSDGPGTTNAWIRKYIFPGGYAPALSEIVPVIESAGLIVTDIEVLRLHYARTLAEWQKRFQARRAEVAALYDERFCRMWEFYLAGAEMAFRHEGQVVYQIQIARRIDALPLTRDYMMEDRGDNEAAARAPMRIVA